MSEKDPVKERRKQARMNTRQNVRHKTKTTEGPDSITILTRFGLPEIYYPSWLTLQRRKKAMIFGGVILFILMVVAACQPRKGTPMYGVCKVFAERLVQYPTTMGVTFVEQYQMGVRIEYHHTDGFGQYKTEMLECTFRHDPVMGMALESVLLNREELPAEIVDDFNEGVLTIVKYPPDLTLPPPMPTEIVDMKPEE